MRHTDGIEVFVRRRASRQAYYEQIGQSRLGTDLSATHLEQSCVIRVNDGDEYEVVVKFSRDFSAGEEFDEHPRAAKLEFLKHEVDSVDVTIIIDKATAWRQVIIPIAELSTVPEHVIATFNCVERKNVFKLAPVRFGRIWSSAGEGANELRYPEAYGNIRVAIGAGSMTSSTALRSWKELSAFNSLKSCKHALSSNDLVTWPRFERGQVVQPVRTQSFTPQRRHHTYQYTFDFGYRLNVGFRIGNQQYHRDSPAPKIANSTSNRPAPIVTAAKQQQKSAGEPKALHPISLSSTASKLDAPQTHIMLSSNQKDMLRRMVADVTAVPGLIKAWHGIEQDLQHRGVQASKNYLKNLEIAIKSKEELSASRAVTLLSLLVNRLRDKHHPEIADAMKSVIEKNVSRWPEGDSISEHLKYMVTWPPAQTVIKYDQVARALLPSIAADASATRPSVFASGLSSGGLPNRKSVDANQMHSIAAEPLVTPKRKASGELLPQKSPGSAAQTAEKERLDRNFGIASMGSITRDQQAGNKRFKISNDLDMSLLAAPSARQPATDSTSTQPTFIDLTNPTTASTLFRDGTAIPAGSSSQLPFRSRTSTPTSFLPPLQSTGAGRSMGNAPITPITETADTPLSGEFDINEDELQDMDDEELVEGIVLKEDEIKLATRHGRHRDVYNFNISKIGMRIEQERRSNSGGLNSDDMIQLRLELLDYQQKLANLQKIKKEGDEEDDSDLERRIEAGKLRRELLKRKRRSRAGNNGCSCQEAKASSVE